MSVSEADAAVQVAETKLEHEKKRGDSRFRQGQAEAESEWRRRLEEVVRAHAAAEEELHVCQSKVREMEGSRDMPGVQMKQQLQQAQQDAAATLAVVASQQSATERQLAEFEDAWRSRFEQLVRSHAAAEAELAGCQDELDAARRSQAAQQSQMVAALGAQAVELGEQAAMRQYQLEGAAAAAMERLAAAEARLDRLAETEAELVDSRRQQQQTAARLEAVAATCAAFEAELMEAAAAAEAAETEAESAWRLRLDDAVRSHAATEEKLEASEAEIAELRAAPPPRAVMGESAAEWARHLAEARQLLAEKEAVQEELVAALVAATAKTAELEYELQATGGQTEARAQAAAAAAALDRARAAELALEMNNLDFGRRADAAAALNSSFARHPSPAASPARSAVGAPAAAAPGVDETATSWGGAQIRYKAFKAAKLQEHDGSPAGVSLFSTPPRVAAAVAAADGSPPGVMGGSADRSNRMARWLEDEADARPYSRVLSPAADVPSPPPAAAAPVGGGVGGGGGRQASPAGTFVGSPAFSPEKRFSVGGLHSSGWTGTRMGWVEKQKAGASLAHVESARLQGWKADRTFDNGEVYRPLQDAVLRPGFADCVFRKCVIRATVGPLTPRPL